MRNKSAKIILFSVILSGLLILPHFVNAQSLSLISDKSTYEVGDDISVVLNLNTSGKLINVVQGTISFPTEFFDIQSIKTGDSFLTLWAKRPAALDDGTIVFSGGVPHGFNGQSGNVFSFILKPKKIGESIISISNAAILLNDGLGTKLSGVKFAPLMLEIESQKTEKAEQPLIDKIPPEPFVPIISRIPSIAENKYFVSFSTTDKQSGISYYEVQEDYVIFPFFGVWFPTKWHKTETPYVLSLQHWWSKVRVRAYDVTGNYREEVVTKPLDKEGFIILNILLVIATIILFFFAIRIYMRFKKQKN